jgi:hypothetical protein
MRPSFSRFAVALALAVGTVACSDQPVSPTLHEKVTIKKVTDFETYQVVDFTVDTEGGWFRIGPHSVYFPPNSICEPSKSTYGPYHWDTPCTVIADSIEIHAEVQKSTTTGKPAIRFWPDLRFAPSTHVDSTGKDIGDDWVVLYMFTEEALAATTDSAATALAAKYRILWSPAAGISAIDESSKDASLKTRIEPSTGLVYRRVKHFSGYQVGSGLVDCLTEPSAFQCLTSGQ